jgi:hypothetical protein
VHLHRCFVAQEALDVVHDISHVVTRHVGAPTSAHAIGSVHENHRHDWHVVARLDRDAVIVEVVEDLVIVRMKDGAGDGAQARVDVPTAVYAGRGMGGKKYRSRLGRRIA